MVGTVFKLANAGVTTDAISDNAVSTAKIADSAITSAKIGNGEIVNADINSSAAIAFSKLNIVKSDITGLGIPGSDTDTTYSAGSGLSLVGTVFKLGTSGVTTNAINDSAVTTAKIADNAITSAKINNGEIVNADINSSAAIAFSKLNIVKSDITGLGIPGSDTDTTYSAGSGLSLSGTTFSLAQQSASSGQVLKWNGSSWAPGTDTDTDTTYSAGSGLSLSGTTFSLAQQSASSGQVLKWNGSSWAPGTDTDTDTTYSAGSGLSLSGTTFSLAQQSATKGKVLKWSGTAWVPSSDNTVATSVWTSWTPTVEGVFSVDSTSCYYKTVDDNTVFIEATIQFVADNIQIASFTLPSGFTPVGSPVFTTLITTSSPQYNLAASKYNSGTGKVQFYMPNASGDLRFFVSLDTYTVQVSGFYRY